MLIEELTNEKSRKAGQLIEVNDFSIELIVMIFTGLV
jgi:hypothetical protein